MSEEISVIISVYNCEKYIKECIGSVLNQTLLPGEIIVINDGSTDSTPEILEKYTDRIKIISRENKGVAYSLNEGIKNSKGRFITFLDSDDRWEKNKLELQIAQFKNNSSLQACFGLSKQFISPELSQEEQNKMQFDPIAHEAYYKGTMMLRRSYFDKTGLFDETLKYGEFMDWFSKAKQMGMVFEMCDQVFLHRRLRPDSLSQQKDYKTSLVRIIKAHLERVREAKKNTTWQEQ